MLDRFFLAFLAFFFLNGWLYGQSNWQWNLYGHLEFNQAFYNHEHQNDDAHESGFGVGEHDFFVQSRISDKMSLLGEFTLGPISEGGYKASIERIRFKYTRNRYLSILIGKMHTPVNYWNDTYHHGRLFFPTIDRPLNFSAFVPIHTLGIRLQGQNIGGLKFGYDVVIGNGIESGEQSNTGGSFSYMGTVHIKPVRGSRFGVSYYREHLSSNLHGGHAHAASYSSNYEGALDFEMTSASAAFFGSKFELLNEFSLTRTTTDTLGTAINLSNYLYVGLRITSTGHALVGIDVLERDANDLYSLAPSQGKIFGGWRQELGSLCNLKTIVEYYKPIGTPSEFAEEKLEVKFQLSYAF